ncbi:hypothetical protein D8Y22_00815 [Salinadaptatus halalkaliphilus]|uniref:DUF4382 domain-containing protein n=1 Tax=Salinadaptatus halalkaliphilus TaxID=2419781 RepID=A0A4S3TQM9_9EURY|nr:hypothetical protein [Salinadaptatus halalkaliphilus]THE66704.1 hypothetical protein D8Y22_00815 [Salinadaptatus halalkaliphilus]
MYRNGRTRRSLLVAGSTTAFAVLAGCTGSSDDETGPTGTDNSGTDGNSADRWDVETPDDPAFLANPDVDGPSDEASYVLATTIRSHGDVGEYDRFAVTVESATLSRADGADVTVPVGVPVDLTGYETGPAGDTVTLTWDLGIPAGTYTSLTLETTPVEIVHEDDGDITDAFEAPPTAEFSADDGAAVSADGALVTEMELEVRYDSASGTPTFEESLAVNTNTMESVVLDPSRYEN